MRTQSLYYAGVFILTSVMLASAADSPPAPASGPTVTVDSETLRRMVQTEVNRQLPALVESEVRKQISDLANRAARANSAASILQTIRGQLELYKIQHNDQFPPLSEMASWKALLNKTDQQGMYNPTGRMVLGPYMQSPPPNPYTGASNVVATGKATARDGWTWDESKGYLRIVLPSSEGDAIRVFGPEAEIAGGKAVSADPRATRMLSTRSTLQTLRGELELYKIQHKDQFPTWNQMADWKALTLRTDGDGNLTSSKALGPYIRQAPVNPLTGKSTIVPVGAANGDTGWVYDGASGKIRAVVSADDSKDAMSFLGEDGIEVAK